MESLDGGPIRAEHPAKELTRERVFTSIRHSKGNEGPIESDKIRSHSILFIIIMTGEAFTNCLPYSIYLSQRNMRRCSTRGLHYTANISILRNTAETSALRRLVDFHKLPFTSGKPQNRCPPTTRLQLAARAPDATRTAVVISK
ncbi:uncharacterized protein H6S33_007178 [Morchella sextelata]|uniref:uncharacterized protein n=1 Tax=Morchella sextelata TaxID=1174677 RepID=UPI001D050F60|nr:uncharacterized protein H6S33_007178 [Morchella sextelata]KAH0604147.1 hypothetical protein H6S33_007178 [Morchella sextelata]